MSELLAAFTRIVGGTSVPSASRKTSSRLRARSAASAFSIASTRTERRKSPRGSTSSWAIICSATLSDAPVPLTITAFRRASAATLTGVSAAAGPSRRARRRASARTASGSDFRPSGSSATSSFSTSGATWSARAFRRKTVRTCVASARTPASSSFTSVSTSARSSGAALTRIALLEASAVTVGRTGPGREALRASSATCTAFATSAALAVESVKTRSSLLPPSERGWSRVFTRPSTTGSSSDGADTSSRFAAGSAVTRGSATGTPARAAATSDSGQRERSDRSGCTAAAAVAASTCRSETVVRSTRGATRVSSSSRVSSSTARVTSASEPTATSAPLVASAMSSKLPRSPAGRVFSSSGLAVATSARGSAFRGV